MHLGGVKSAQSCVARAPWVRTLPAALLATTLAAAPGTGLAKCTLKSFALPVTMNGLRPMVSARINGAEAHFIADSGAFYSMITPAAAAEFKLRVEPAPFHLILWGVGGGSSAAVTTVREFVLGDSTLTKIQFIVAGSSLGGEAVGLLGDNVLGRADTEYDLANGVIRLIRPDDCRKSTLAYWATSQPYSVIDIDWGTASLPQSTGTAYVNGTRIRVMFDTGASTSILTMRAAERAGVRPGSAGVVAAGASYGIGEHTPQTWIGPFASFRIGDEEVRNTRLRFGEINLPFADMLIGADFFLSHRVYVAASQHKLYFTYNGGPVFNLTTMRALPPAAAEPAPASGTEPGPAAAAASQPAQPEPLDAAGYARRGSASASRRDYEHALADLTKAIALDPTQADYFYERGRAYGSNNQTDKAFEDFSQAIKLEPGDVPARLARAELRVRRNDPADAISPDLDAADRAAPKEGDMRLALGNLYQRIGNYPAAIAQYDHWIDSHNRDDIQMPRARHARCSARALTGRSLEQALDDCNFALRKDPKVAAFFDSRGLVYLRQGKYDKAIADYDAALALDPKLAWALYGRGLARQHLGQSAAGQADVAAATALAPKIADEAARNGVVP